MLRRPKRSKIEVHHHHHVPEGLGLIPIPCIFKMKLSLHLFLGRPMCLRPFGLYCSACLGILFVSILCMCCSHFSWYCFISFTICCAPVFSLIHWFFSLSSFVIPRKCLKNFICAASKRCSSLFFSTQASLPNFNAALAVIKIEVVAPKEEDEVYLRLYHILIEIIHIG